MAKFGENIYKRKDGRWEARVLKGYNEEGKALYAYFYGRTYKEVKEKIFNSLQLSSNIEKKKDDSPCLNYVVDMWLDNVKVRIKESSYVKYYNLIMNHIKPQLGNYPVIKISSTIINDYVLDKLKSGKCNEADGLSEKTPRGSFNLSPTILIASFIALDATIIASTS